jgi:hypothetical protein
MKGFSICLSSCFAATASAQQLPYTASIYNKFLINPSIAGADGFTRSI